MAALDWIFGAVLLGSVLMGAWRGLIFEVLSLLGWVVSFFVAQWLASDVATMLPVGQGDGLLRYALGFVAVFVVSVFVWGLLASLCKRLIDVVGLRPVDRTLGAFFGLVRGAVLLLAATAVAQLTPLHGAVWWQESQGTTMLEQGLGALKPILPQEFGRHLP